MKNKKIYFEDLKLTNEFFLKKARKKLFNTISSGKYILSENVERFEKKFAKYIGTKYCIGVGNGLDALTIALHALNLQKGSEVIVASNSYIACILAVINAGLKPILIEPDISTYNIDVNQVEQKINKKTKVVLALHLYGKPCNIIELKKICKRKKIFLIEDCAQSHGASIGEKKTGSFGDLGCFSFYPTKNLGAIGDAGAVTTNNKIFYERVKKIRNYGSSKRYKNDLIGVNSRLDEIQASFLDFKLNYLDIINKKKRFFAKLYDKYLSNKFIKPVTNKNIYDVFYIYNIRHPKRDYIKKTISRKNIITDIHYPTPPYRQKSLISYFKNQDFSISNEIHKTTLSLPISFSHTTKDIMRVIKELNNIKL
jgi:dTDP-4-amino-4,6-dideoxygalactose transaminase